MDPMGFVFFLSLGIESYRQRVIGVSNHLLGIVGSITILRR